ncbi:MAG: hypothetical protein JO097_00095, partial [Acidobacteriaceae bacterium]|nr:hypothetical protein [Acidobacteriaceae bacterium]
MQASISGSDDEPEAYPSHREFLAGDVLADRFEIVRLLGRGGMGEVYEASDRVLDGSPVAIKTILSKNALDGEAR